MLGPSSGSVALAEVDDPRDRSPAEVDDVEDSEESLRLSWPGCVPSDSSRACFCLCLFTRATWALACLLRFLPPISTSTKSNARPEVPGCCCTFLALDLSMFSDAITGSRLRDCLSLRPMSYQRHVTVAPVKGDSITAGIEWAKAIKHGPYARPNGRKRSRRRSLARGTGPALADGLGRRWHLD